MPGTWIWTFLSLAWIGKFVLKQNPKLTLIKDALIWLLSFSSYALEATLKKKKNDKIRTLSEKGGGGLALSEVLSEISDDYKFVYFTLSHDKEVHISEQNHQNQKLSAGSDMDF